MSNNEISVPREQLKEIVDLFEDGRHWKAAEAADKLRALLAAPDPLWNPHPAQANLAALLILLAQSGVKVSGGIGDEPWSVEPAVQLQGEPVARLMQARGKDGEAYRNRVTTAKPTMRDIEIAWGKSVIDRFTTVIKPLYASPSAPPAPVALHIPDECPHLIVFDDADRQQLIFAGAGARESALKAWEQISGSWNAHLFVRVERNSRDDRYPSAKPAPVAMVLPARKTAEEYYTRLGNCNSARLAADEFNSALDEVARLNK